MRNNEEIMKAVKRNFRGANLPHRKNTAEIESVIMPPPAKVVIPMQQHIGAPCSPCVKKGDTVFVGTKIGDSDKFVSAPIHSSVSGVVAELSTILLPSGAVSETVVIESDGLMTPDPNLAAPKVDTAEELVKAARDSGLVGLGGAGFPTHVKLSIDPNKRIDTLIINCAECEPYITSDYRECMENTENILEGVYRIKELMGFEKVVICVEDNKPKAIEALYRVAADERDTDNSVRILELKSRYPQGAEKMMIYSATGRKLPLGKLPADVGCVVMNVTSISFLNKYINTGMPLVSKTVTVDGGAVANPCNVVVPIGASVGDVFEFCGGFKEAPQKLLYGGPMMGTAILDASMPILKQNNAILALTCKETNRFKEQPCIRCGRCAKICPMNLQPLETEPAFRVGELERVRALNTEYCIECGCCSYICPSKRHLTQTMRLAKAALKKKA